MKPHFMPFKRHFEFIIEPEVTGSNFLLFKITGTINTAEVVVLQNYFLTT